MARLNAAWLALTLVTAQNETAPVPESGLAL